MGPNQGAGPPVETFGVVSIGDTHCEWSDTLDVTGPAYYYVLARGSEGEVIWSPPIRIEISD